MAMPHDQDPLEFYAVSAKKCIHCEELSICVKNLQDTIEQQNNTIMKILEEHKVLLSKIVSRNNVKGDTNQTFPIKSEQKLSELNVLIQSQTDPYIIKIKSLLKGNVGRYLNEVLGPNIIHEFNVDGTHGKHSLKKYQHFYSALISAIAAFVDKPDIALRKAFQLQKKRVFKANRLKKLKLLGTDN